MQTDLKLALNTIGLLQIDYNELNDTYAKVDQLLKYFNLNSAVGQSIFT